MARKKQRLLRVYNTIVTRHISYLLWMYRHIGRVLKRAGKAFIARIHIPKLSLPRWGHRVISCNSEMFCVDVCRHFLQWWWFEDNVPYYIRDEALLR